MKLSLGFLSVIALSSATTLPSTAEEAECGDLDVMSLDHTKLPDGVTSSDVRKCKERPSGDIRTRKNASLAPLDATGVSPVNNTVIKGRDGDKKCYYNEPYGCAGGYCWKSCGSGGEWCWTAKSLGFGDWYTCKTYRDCSDSFTWACGQACLSSCGCSC